jgi:hypothetical protein
MNDLHNNSRAQRVVPPVAVGTTGTGQTGKVIDRQGYGGVEFICGYGAVTATNAVFTVTVKEGDVTSSLTSVADADLLGTELLAGVGATASRVSGTSKNVVKRIGYKGLKRYVNASVKSTVTAGTPVSIEAVLHSPMNAATANP